MVHDRLCWSRWRLTSMLLVVAAMSSLVVSAPTPARAAGEVVTDRDPLNQVACPEAAVPGGGFTDTANSVHGVSVDCLVWWGVTQGVSATSFAPEHELRRAQLASFLYRALKQTGQPIPAPQVSFSDVRGGSHREAIEVLATLQVVGGVDGDRFAPDVTVTRGPLAAMITRLHREVIGATLLPAGAPFTDVAGTTPEQAVQQLVALGVTQGTTATAYSPGAPVLRGQIATFLTRYLSRLLNEGQVVQTPRDQKETGAAPHVPGVRYETHGDVSADERSAIVASVNAAHLEHDYDGGLTIHLFDPTSEGVEKPVVDAFLNALGTPGLDGSPEWRADVWRSLAGGAGIAGNEVLFINVDSTARSILPTPAKNLGQTMLHESAHMVHESLVRAPLVAPPDEVPDAGPVWPNEGAAEHAGYVLGARYGFQDLIEAQRQTVRWSEATTATLRSMETQDGMHAPGVDEGYGQAARAGMLLAELAGWEAVQHEYCALLGAGVPWPQAFEQAFGLDIDRFYTLFEQAKQQGFRATLGRTTTDRPNDRPGPQVKMVYAVAADGPDLGHDRDGTVGAIGRGLQRWFAEQPHGQWLALDTYLGVPDVAFVRRSDTLDEQHQAGCLAPAGVRDALHAAGLDDPDTIYAVVYEGTNDGQCGGGYVADEGVIVLSIGERDGRGCSPDEWTYAPITGRNDSYAINFVDKLLEALHFEMPCYQPFPPDGRIPNPTSPQHDVRHLDRFGADRPLELDANGDTYWAHARTGDCTDIPQSPHLSQPIAWRGFAPG